MNTVQRIAKNAAALYSAQIVVTLLSLALAICIARILGSAILGKFAFAGGFTAIIAIFLDLGFNTLIIREIARDKSQASKYISNIIVIKAILAIVIFGSTAIIINLMDYPPDTTLAVLILCICKIFEAISAIFTRVFQAFERMEYNALISISSQLAITSLALAAVLLGYGLIEIVSAFTIGSLFRLTISFLICSKKFAKLKKEIDLNFWKGLIKSALPLGFLPMAGIICLRTDIVMLSIMKDDSTVGWYSVANGLPLGFAQIPWIFMSVLLPLMAVSFVSSQNTLRTIYEKSFKFLFILGLPMAAGLFLLSDRIILLLFGAAFLPSIIALQILSWRLLLNFVVTPLSFTLISMNKQNQMAIIVGISAAVNVVLNLILIPPLSYVGAAITTLISSMITFVLYSYLVSKHLSRLPLHKIAIKPLVACLAMGLFVYWSEAINLFLLIGMAAVLYFVILWLSKAFSQEDVNMIKEVTRIEKLKVWLANR